MAIIAGARALVSFLVAWTLGGFAAPPASATSDFAARLSPAALAMEYWDITGWFASGHRFSARFLITNQGPGTRTGAAVAHLVLPAGTLVPISYGRLSDRWTLSDGGRRLKIASAVLDLTGSAFRVEIDSDKRGIKLDLELPIAPPVRLDPVAGAYALEVLMPARARGRYLLRGMAAPVMLEGTAVLTHTMMEQSEPDVVTRRAELMGTAGDVALYVNDVTLAGGGRHAAVVRRRGGEAQVSHDVTLTYAAPRANETDAEYVTAGRWGISGAAWHASVALPREYLRWDPLEMLPQPFRLLVSLQSAPRRVWSDAEIDSPSLPAKGRGVAVVTFAQPGTLE